MIVIALFTDLEEWSKEKSVSYSFGGGWCYSKRDLSGGVNAGVAGLIPVSGRSPGGGRDKPLQDSCLENSMGRRAWSYSP